MPGGSPVAVSLSSSNGYTGPLQIVLAGAYGQFVFDRIPAGSYQLNAAGPVTSINGLEPRLDKSPWYGSVHLDVRAPEISGIQIHLRAAAR
jgi:hypothetical protein